MQQGSLTSRFSRLAAAALSLGAAWLALPATAGERGPQSVQTPAAIYHNYCSVCHGDAGDGNSRARGSMRPPPRDFTAPQVAQEMTRERMIAAVRTGVPGTAMVGWQKQLTDPQIVQVVDYMRERFMRVSATGSATASTAGSPAASTAASAAGEGSRGRQLYARVCSVCHGDSGAGSMWASANLKPAPRDFSSPEARKELTRERMLRAVAAGVPGTAMMGYGTRMSQDDMAAVVDYVRTAIMRTDVSKEIPGTHARGAPATGNAAGNAKPAGGNPAVAAAPPAAPSAAPSPADVDGPTLPVQPKRQVPSIRPDMTLPMPSGLVGNFATGKKYYEANCATCHGSTGDGQGPRAYFINPKPRVLISEESRFFMNRPVIFAGVSAGRRGTEMPAWDKVATPQEIADVSEYVFRAFIQPGLADVANKKK